MFLYIAVICFAIFAYKLVVLLEEINYTAKKIEFKLMTQSDRIEMMKEKYK